MEAKSWNDKPGHEEKEVRLLRLLQVKLSEFGEAKRKNNQKSFSLNAQGGFLSKTNFTWHGSSLFKFFLRGLSGSWSDLAGRFFSSASDPIAHSAISSPETLFLNSYSCLPLPCIIAEYQWTMQQEWLCFGVLLQLWKWNDIPVTWSQLTLSSKEKCKRKFAFVFLAFSLEKVMPVLGFHKGRLHCSTCSASSEILAPLSSSLYGTAIIKEMEGHPSKKNFRLECWQRGDPVKGYVFPDIHRSSLKLSGRSRSPSPWPRFFLWPKSLS